MRVATTGASNAGTPRATDPAVDEAHRPITKESRLISNKSGSSRALRHDGRHDDGERQREERYPAHAGPYEEGSGGERAEHEIAAGRRIGDGGEDGGPRGEDRDQDAQLLGLRPRREVPCGHALDGSAVRGRATPATDGDATSDCGGGPAAPAAPRGTVRARCARRGLAAGTSGGRTARAPARRGRPDVPRLRTGRPASRPRRRRTAR